MLRARQFFNLKFKRQYSVGRYILDFYCPETMLCVELDGGQHVANVEYDQRRTKFLAGLGIKVVRYLG